MKPPPLLALPLTFGFRLGLNDMNWTAIVAILSITVLELYALSQGINGLMLSGGLVVIAGLGGFQVHKWTASRHQEKHPTKEEGE